MLSGYAVEAAHDLKAASAFDGVVVVAPTVRDVADANLRAPLQAVADVDKKAESGLFVAPLSGLSANAKRVVFSGTGPLDKDYDDVRR